MGLDWTKFGAQFMPILTKLEHDIEDEFFFLEKRDLMPRNETLGSRAVSLHDSHVKAGTTGNSRLRRPQTCLLASDCLQVGKPC